MRFSVPTNWQDELISRVNKDPVDELYGKLTDDFIGGGRPSYGIPQISKKDAVSHINKVCKTGLKFNYLLNATCLGNREWTIHGHRAIRRLLDWLAVVGIDKITVAIPYVLQLIKKQYPGFKVCVSTSARVNTLERAKYWEELGADVITLDSVDVNRNFRLISQIRKELKCGLQLIANVNCLYNCSLRNYHCATLSHASQTVDACRGFFVDYSYLMCSYHRIKNPVNIIRADWIRPEDIYIYENMGIDRIKLVDRNMPIDTICLVVNAYIDRRYDGNLLDLFPTPQKSLMHHKFGFLHKLKYFFRPLSINPFRMYKAKELFFDIFYIDNRLLNGYIDYFIKSDCTLKSCQECNYCQSWADRVIKFDHGLQQKLVTKYEEYLSNVVCGNIFKYFSKYKM